MLNEQWIRCFLSVGEHLSFTKAAKELYLTQQSVSKHIKNLEKELQVDLFERSTRKIILTEAGDRYYQMFLRWRVELETVQKETRQSTNIETSLRIGLLSRMSSGYVPVISRELKKENPDTQIALSHRAPIDLNEGLFHNNYDLIFTYRDFIEKNKDYETLSVGYTPLLLALSESHPMAGEILNFPEMQKEVFCCCINTGDTQVHALKCAMDDRKAFGLGEGPIRLFEDIDECNMAVEMGEGFTFCSRTNLFSKNPFIRCYPVGKNTEIIAVWKKGNHRRLLKVFLGRMQERMQVDETLIY
jgi:DNA-binding transcriptional LysR family regulator